MDHDLDTLTCSNHPYDESAAMFLVRLSQIPCLFGFLSIMLHFGSLGGVYKDGSNYLGPKRFVPRAFIQTIGSLEFAI